ncbi:MAG: RHS repeat domain-containing protein [Bacteroidota bacterium]
MKSIPAYRLNDTNTSLAYPGMGLKGANSSNKNMLTQEGASFTFRMKGNFNPDNPTDWEDKKESLIGASLQTWTGTGLEVSIPFGVLPLSTSGKYRKLSGYSFIGDGAVNPDGTHAAIDLNIDFKVSDVINNSHWRKSGEATLYDANSHVLEAKDINGNYAASKFDPYLKRVLSSATNVRYNGFAYSGAEEVSGNLFLGGGVVTSLATIDEGSAHTGQYALAVNAGQKGFSFEATDLKPEATYLVYCWTNNPAQTKIRYEIDGNLQPESSATIKNMGQVGDWHQLRATINVPANTTIAKFFVQAGSQNIRVDDFLVRPIDAGFTGYVYNQWGELSDIINANNLSTHYEYDDMGRLKSVWTESFQYGKRQISENTIKYIDQN